MGAGSAWGRSETRIAFVEALGRRTRLGPWEDQKISTYRKIREAIETGRWDEAAALTNYFVDEASVCYLLYRQWIGDLHAFLAERGASKTELEDVEARIADLLKLPDGSPFDARREWDRLRTAAEETVGHCYRSRGAAAVAGLERMRETWRRAHDRDADHTYALMAEVKRRFGEPAIREMFDRILVPLFAWRYEKFDVDKHPWDESLEILLLVACEAMRGHLVGPERTGDFELIETEDRFILRFDPCGSGGRTVRGDPIEGTPARMEPPYSWPVTEEAHPWNHYTPGICLYCVHCIVLMEEMPIDRFGYPVRVVDPPVYPDSDPERPQPCQWQIFKDPTAVPEEYYTRVGRRKPAAFGSRARGAGELPIVTTLPGSG